MTVLALRTIVDCQQLTHAAVAPLDEPVLQGQAAVSCGVFLQGTLSPRRASLPGQCSQEER